MKFSHSAKWIYGITQVMVFLLILLSAGIGAVAGWLMLEPREIPELTQAIRQAANHPQSPYQIRIGNAILSLGDLTHPLELSMKNLRVETRESQELLNIPRLQLSLDIPALVMGEVRANRITLIDPDITVFQDKKGVFYLATQEQEKAIPLYDILGSANTSSEAHNRSQPLIPEHIKDLEIIGATLHFESQLNQLKLDVPDAGFSIRQNDGRFHGRADLKALQKDRKDAVLEMVFGYNTHTQDATLRLDFKALQLSTYAKIIPQLASFHEVDLPLSGHLEAALQLPATLKNLSVEITDAGVGTFRYEPYFQRKMTVREFALKAGYDHATQQAKLHHFSYSSKKGAKISAEGTWQQDALKRMAVKGKLEVTGMSKKLLINLWPQGVAVNPRSWIDSSIIEAFIPHASISINAPIGTLEGEALPDETLLGNIEVQNAEINYTEGFPHIKQATGVVQLTGNTLIATLQAATTLNETKITGAGTVKILSLVAENTPIVIDLPVSTTARDVLVFMKSTPYKLPQTVNLNPETMTGNLFGQVHVNVLDKPSPQEDDVTFNLGMEVKAFNQPQFFRKMDVTRASGKIIATDKDFRIEHAAGQLDGQRVQMKAHMHKQGEDYQIKAALPYENLAAFGVDVAPFLSGEIGLTLDWKERYAQGTNFTLLADITPSLLEIDAIDYQKPSGVTGTVQLEGISTANGYQIPTFSLEIPTEQNRLSGSLSLNKEGALQELNLSDIHFAGTRGKATYRPITGGHYLRASGEVLDISFRDKEETPPPEAQKATEKTPAEPLKIPALDVEMQFARLATDKAGERSLKNLNITMRCDTDFCQQMNLQALADARTPFTLRIENQQGKRVLTAHTPDAGTFLKQANLFDDMKNGEMQIAGIFQDELPNRPLTGKITIGAHRVKNIPILAKLLTVATFTGIVDIMSGEGLMFQKSVIPFRKENMVMYLDEAKSVGPSVGITASGNVDFNQDTLKLKGVVVPAYMFNALVSSIPVVGNIYNAIAGEGLVAVNYSLSGDLENPDVSVNPLSALTPGFLRGFFSIFDSNDAETQKRRKETQEALDKLESQIDAVKAPQPLPSPPEKRND